MHESEPNAELIALSRLHKSVKHRIERRQRTAMIERTWELETLYDLTTLLSESLATGRLAQEFLPDSRSRMDTVIEWANEFNVLHAWTDWGEVGYIKAVELWFKAKSDAHASSAIAIGGKGQF